MIVRRARVGDARALLALSRELVGDAPLASADQVAVVLSHPGTEIWVVELDGHLCAMATLHVLPNVTQAGRPYALIENVVTAANHRARGLGRAVMDACIKAAWSQDAYKIMLMTGQTASARGFYEKLGFDGGEKWAMTLRRAPLRRTE